MDLEVFGHISTAVEPIFNWFSSAPDASGIANTVGLLAAACTAIVGIVFMWWGVRKVAQMIMSAFRSGRISL